MHKCSACGLKADAILRYWINSTDRKDRHPDDLYTRPMCEDHLDKTVASCIKHDLDYEIVGL